MGKCQNCKYWDQDFDSLYFYNKNFGECMHPRVTNIENIKKNYNDKENKNYNNYDLIYSADGVAQLRMNKDFGCINFEENVTIVNI